MVTYLESASPEQGKGIVYRETFLIRGAPVHSDAVRVNGQAFVISGRFVKTASLKPGRAEWETEISDPAEVIRTLKAAPARIDLFRFWQRIPDSEAKYPYYKEWRDVAAIPVSTFEHWWEKQINAKTRNMVRKSEKLGVTVREVPFDDDLVRGIMGIFNESPVKRGKRFWHYGKDFETVKRDMGYDLEDSIFIGAYHGSELIGFIKLIVSERFAMTTLILDKMSQRDKSPMNGLIAKAVEVCAKRKIPFITYTVWRRGEHGKFQERNGFERITVPEYFVPLTALGALALRLGLHKGLKGAIPEGMMIWLLKMRAKWYALKYPKAGA